MLHHSFEHMIEPREALRALSKRLVKGNTLLIRIPVLAQAWCDYGVDCVQLDAPRHLFLHTNDSVLLLASSVGLKIEHVVCDS